MRLLDCTNSKIINSEELSNGLYMAVTDNEHLTDTENTLIDIIRDSNIPIRHKLIRLSDITQEHDERRPIWFLYVGQ